MDKVPQDAPAVNGRAARPRAAKAKNRQVPGLTPEAVAALPPPRLLLVNHCGDSATLLVDYPAGTGPIPTREQHLTALVPAVRSLLRLTNTRLVEPWAYLLTPRPAAGGFVWQQTDGWELDDLFDFLAHLNDFGYPLTTGEG